MPLNLHTTMRFPNRPFLVSALILVLNGFAHHPSEAAPPDRLQPKVELEETVYQYTPANNGAGPMWCSGSTCLVRIGDTIFASGLETIENAQPLNNCRWVLFKRDATGWTRLYADVIGRTREPSPIVGFPDGRVFLSANPTLGIGAEPNGGPARPKIFQFSTDSAETTPQTILPVWDGDPEFREHSYRSFAADGAKQEVIIFQNIGYTHAEWTFRDPAGNWRGQGKLKWPWGAEYDKPQPIRVCYPNVVIRNRAVYFCGVSDILEPYQNWRTFKKDLTGREWDYDFRRLFFTWTPDVTLNEFSEWIEIASRDKTSGWISPGDLWVAPDGMAHIIWSERAIDERLKERFFPSANQSHSLNYATVQDGKITSRRALLVAEEGGSQEIPGKCRFQIGSNNRLFVIYYVGGSNTGGASVSENRVFEILDRGQTTPSVRIPIAAPFTDFFTATVRAGSPPSETVDLLGHQAGKPMTISYARIKLW